MALPANATRQWPMDRTRPVLQLIDKWDSDWHVHWQGMRWLANNSHGQWSLNASLVNHRMRFDTYADLQQWVVDNPTSSDIPSDLW